MEIKNILTTNEAKYMFIAGLIRLAKADGVIDDNEFTFFQQAAYGIGLDEAAIKPLTALKDTDLKISIRFNSSQEKMFFLMQAIQLCLIDNTYSDTEKAELNNICAEMGVSQEALNAVEQWAFEGIAWSKRGDALLELN